jgi:hypothetical protein
MGHGIYLPHLLHPDGEGLHVHLVLHPVEVLLPCPRLLSPSAPPLDAIYTAMAQA